MRNTNISSFILKLHVEEFDWIAEASCFYSGVPGSNLDQDKSRHVTGLCAFLQSLRGKKLAYLRNWSNLLPSKTLPFILSHVFLACITNHLFVKSKKKNLLKNLHQFLFSVRAEILKAKILIITAYNFYGINYFILTRLDEFSLADRKQAEKRCKSQYSYKSFHSSCYRALAIGQSLSSEMDTRKTEMSFPRIRS
jgi:hypothetical protein